MFISNCSRSVELRLEFSKANKSFVVPLVALITINFLWLLSATMEALCYIASNVLTDVPPNFETIM